MAIGIRINGRSAQVKELVGKIAVTTMPFKQVLQEQPKFVQVQIVAVIPIVATPQLLAVFVRQTLEPELWVESYLTGIGPKLYVAALREEVNKCAKCGQRACTDSGTAHY